MNLRKFEECVQAICTSRHVMEFVKQQLTACTGKKPDDDAKRAVLEMLYEVEEMHSKIEKLTSKTAMAEFLDKCVKDTRKPKLLNDMFGFVKSCDGVKKTLVECRDAEVKRQERIAKKSAAAANAASNATAAVGGQQSSNNVVVNVNLGQILQDLVQVQQLKPAKGSSTKPNERKPIPKAVRNQSWDSWIGKKVGEAPCYCCRMNMISKAHFHCGHVIADTDGGESKVENLRPICSECNLSMGAMHMQQYCKKHYRDELDIPYDTYECKAVAKRK